MIVKLRDLKPCSVRDFAVDPIDETAVAQLVASIREFGFWGGVGCRRMSDGSIEIIDGHQRVRAAIESGVETAEVHVAEGVNDARALRIYARRANHPPVRGSAFFGAVLAAARLAGSENSTWGPVRRALGAAPGFDRKTIGRALKTLKAAGLLATGGRL